MAKIIVTAVISLVFPIIGRTSAFPVETDIPVANVFKHFAPGLSTPGEQLKCNDDGSCTFAIDDMLIRQSSFSPQTGLVSNRWPFGVVPYVIHSSITSNPGWLAVVQEAISDLNESCINMRPANIARDVAYILITNKGDGGCYAFLGYSGTKGQVVNLGGSGCFRKGTVIHEIMHALGIFHEQSRDDRDGFVRVNFGNIRPGAEGNFFKTSESTHSETSYYGVPYNYDSLMHYSATSFANPGTKTIEALTNPQGPYMGNPNGIGQRSRLSSGDIMKINSMYKFSTKCQSKS